MKVAWSDIRLLILIAMAAWCLGSCTDREFDELDFDNEIRPVAQVIEGVASTKAVSNYYGPISGSFTTSFPIGVYAYDSSVGWKPGASNVATPNSPNLINNDNASVSGTATHSVSFDNGVYYFPSGGQIVNFYAYAPFGTETTASGSGTSPSVTIPIDGRQDVMWASATGRKQPSVAVQQPQFAFVHKLTQLQFVLKSGTNYPASGNYVTSLLVKAQPTSLVMNVGTGAITASGSANIQAIPASNPTGIEITSAGTSVNSPILTMPSSGANAYLLDITVKVGATGTAVYSDVPVSLTSSAGSVHLLTISFTQKAPNLSVSAGSWTVVSGGTIGGL